MVRKSHSPVAPLFVSHQCKRIVDSSVTGNLGAHPQAHLEFRFSLTPNTGSLITVESAKVKTGSAIIT